MDNKLSELSKPVMYSITCNGVVEEIGGDSQGFVREEVQSELDSWKNGSVGIPDGYSVSALYSQEYVSALLAERDSNQQNYQNAMEELRIERSQRQAADQRLAELEAEITNIVDSHAETVAELRAKLATPVRLPSEHELRQVACSECAGNCLELVEGTVRAAGFTVEGDE